MISGKQKRNFLALRLARLCQHNAVNTMLSLGICGLVGSSTYYVPTAYAQSSTSSHKVRSNETLSEIAANYGIKLTDLAKYNGLSWPYRINVGQTISLPTSVSTYKVRNGDTVSEVAEKFGTTVSQLANMNGLGRSFTIRVGQTLRIPAKSTAKSTAIASRSPSRPKSSSSGRSAPILKVDPATSRFYTIRNGDRLSDIAKAHGVSLLTLSQANGITNPNRIRKGQKLVVPPAGTVPEQPTSPSAYKVSAPKLDYRLQKTIDQTRVTPNRWKYIVIHHSASRKGNIRYMDEDHLSRGMENGLAYHFVIGNGLGMGDGEIGVSRRWTLQLHGGHLASDALNEIALGICLVGDFQKRPPTAKQTESLLKLCHALRIKCDMPVSAIRTHQHINTKPTACPGKRFPIESLIKKLGTFE